MDVPDLFLHPEMIWQNKLAEIRRGDVGFSHSFIAVQGLTREQALEALGMAVSEVRTDLLEGVTLFDWSDDWLVVLSADDRDALEGELAELGSLGRAAVAYGVDTDVPYATGRGYEGGKDSWTVTVKPNQGRISVVGQPPEQLDSIIGAAKAEQQNTEVDLFFDIPARLAESICGFLIDEGDPDALQYVSLKSTGLGRPKSRERAPKGPGFFARLFGRS